MRNAAGKLFPLTASDTFEGYLQAHKDLFLPPNSATSSAQSHSPETVNSSSVAAAIAAEPQIQQCRSDPALPAAQSAWCDPKQEPWAQCYQEREKELRSDTS